MNKYTLAVDGMHCPGCENLVARELNAIPGVTDVEGDSEADEVVVHGDPRTEERVRQAVAELGYEPK